MTSEDPSAGVNHCYRVSGHYGGRWDNTEWMKTFTEAKQAFRKIKQGNWSQLSIERSDGKLKASPESQVWFDQSGDSNE